MMNRVQLIAEGKLKVTSERVVLRSWKDAGGQLQQEFDGERRKYKVILGDSLWSFISDVDPRLKDGQSFELLLATKKEEGPPDVDSDPKHGPTGEAGHAEKPDLDRDEGQEPGARVRAREPASTL
jgi:hypothetical protein